MKYEKVTIKQIPESNVAAIGLDKYNRSRFPKCADYFQAAEVVPGKYLTGIDPEGLELQELQDLEKKEVIKEERTALIKYLQEQLGEDLSSTSNFWERFVIKIDTDNPLTLNRVNPRDVVTYHVLVANGFVAPNFASTSDSHFINTKYYCHVDDVEMDEKVSTAKKRDQARAELYKMADNKDMMFLIGSYLEGTRYKKTMSANTLYGMLSEYIDDKKNPDNVASFNKAAATDIEDLQYKVTIETAIRKKIIKYKEGQYYRGGVNLGKNILEIMKNLKMPEFANEFISIHDDVNSR